MKNSKALVIALLLSVSSVSVSVCAGNEPTVAAAQAPAVQSSVEVQQRHLANIEKHLEYLASDVRLKNYLVVGSFGLSLFIGILAAANR